MTTDNLQEISAQIVHDDTASFDARQILEQMKQEAAKEAAIAAEENRIPGVAKFSRMWLIPKDAEKPKDNRRKK